MPRLTLWPLAPCDRSRAYLRRDRGLERRARWESADAAAVFAALGVWVERRTREVARPARSEV